MNQSTIPFEGHNIRRIYDEESETWFFSIVDIVAALTDSVIPQII
jgi:DNA-damage-inducible protein D